MSGCRVVALSLVLAALGSPAAAQQAATPLPAGPESYRTRPAAFTDPARREKLATAFPEIDRLMRDYARRQHIPGATWGVVIDGELAHLGVEGLREAAEHEPGGRRQRLPHRVDDQELHGDGHPPLRDEGKLSLDDPAERYVPELRTSRTRPRLAPRSRCATCSRTPPGSPKTTPGATSSWRPPTRSSRR
jgi:CubicO group peptidase (beta-lactamase class C family)